MYCGECPLEKVQYKMEIIQMSSFYANYRQVVRPYRGDKSRQSLKNYHEYTHVR